MDNFGRQIELLIGPSTEGDDNPQDLALRIFSDGSQDGPKVTFRISKTWYGASNFSEISVYNLHETARQRLAEVAVKGNIAITVNGGYASDKKLSMLFIGGILTAYSERQGPDIVTRITAWTMAETLANSIVSFTFSNDMTLVDTLLRCVDGLNVKNPIPRKIDIRPDRISGGGISFGGQLKDLLDMLGRQYGFTWSIQDGTFYAFGDHSQQHLVSTAEKKDNDPIVLSGKNGSLIEAYPLLSGPKQFLIGAKIRTFIQPGLAVWKTVTVVDSLNPSLDNDYTIHCIDFRGDTFGNEWMAELQCFTDDSTARA